MLAHLLNIKSLAANKIKALTSAKVNSVSSAQTSQLISAQINALSKEQLSNLNITYDTLLKIIKNDTASGINSNIISSLKALFSKFNTVGGIHVSAYLKYISNAFINGSNLNQYWTGGQKNSVALGDLTSNSSAQQVNELISKWFLGEDLPSSKLILSGYGTYNVKYSATDTKNPVFSGSGPSMNDVNQGALGDCYLLAVLAEVAHQNADLITSMISINGNNTFGIGFSVAGATTYVTVNNQLAYGGSVFNAGNNIWASLVEQGYAELQGMGNLTGNNVNYGNSFTTIGNGGSPEVALAEITGAQDIVDYSGYGSVWRQVTLNGSLISSVNSHFVGKSGSSVNMESLQNTLVSDLTAGDYLVLSSNSTKTDSNGKYTLIADHAMAVYGFDTKTSLFEIYNPWGTEASGQNWEATFEVSLKTLCAAGDTISVACSTTLSGSSVAHSSIVSSKVSTMAILSITQAAANIATLAAGSVESTAPLALSLDRQQLNSVIPLAALNT